MDFDNIVECCLDTGVCVEYRCFIWYYVLSHWIWIWRIPLYFYNFRLFSSYQLNAHFLYSITIYMLHYNPQHVSSSTLLIIRRTNCVGCPTRYRTRHFFNNFTTNEDIAGGPLLRVATIRRTTDTHYRHTLQTHTTDTFLFISHTTNVLLFNY